MHACAAPSFVALGMGEQDLTNASLLHPRLHSTSQAQCGAIESARGRAEAFGGLGVGQLTGRGAAPLSRRRAHDSATVPPPESSAGVRSGVRVARRACARAMAGKDGGRQAGLEVSRAGDRFRLRGLREGWGAAAAAAALALCIVLDVWTYIRR